MYELTQINLEGSETTSKDK